MSDESLKLSERLANLGDACEKLHGTPEGMAFQYREFAEMAAALEAEVERLREQVRKAEAGLPTCAACGGVIYTGDGMAAAVYWNPCGPYHAPRCCPPRPGTYDGVPLDLPDAGEPGAEEVTHGN